MTIFPHDQFVKEYFPELFQDYGIVTAGESLSGEMREIDVLFIPQKPVPTTPETLGLLGKLAQKTTLFEVFRNPVNPHQIRSCLAKLFDFQSIQLRENQGIKEEELPVLWIISPTVSERIINLFGAELKLDYAEKGIYLLANGLKTGIVVIHQLPVTPDTLWLRLLGRGKVQETAISELKQLSIPHQNNVIQLVYGLLAMLAANKRNKTNIKEDDINMVSLKEIFQERLAEEADKALQQGLQQGIQQGIELEKSRIILRQIKRKFGEISSELETRIKTLSREKIEILAEDLLDFNSQEDLLNWLENNQ